MWTSVIIIEMKEIDVSNFFQISNSGKSRLEGWIDTEPDKDRLKRIRRAFVAANRADLMDPQGVFLRTGSSPILFVDVHTRGLPTTNFDSLIQLIDVKLESQGRAPD